MSDQSKLGSLVEALANVFVGFWINYVMNMLILPLFFGHSIGFLANFYVGMVYTVISTVRSYILRRTFNGWLHATVTRYFPA